MAHEVSTPYRRARLIVVGEGRAGKTTLLRALRNQPFEDTASTVGIATNTLETAALKKWREVNGGECEKVHSIMVARNVAVVHATE